MILDLDFKASGFKFEERIGAEKAVSADLFAANDTFEEEAGSALSFDPGICGDRREGVAREFAINGQHEAWLGLSLKFVPAWHVANQNAQTPMVVRCQDHERLLKNSRKPVNSQGFRIKENL